MRGGVAGLEPDAPAGACPVARGIADVRLSDAALSEEVKSRPLAEVALDDVAPMPVLELALEAVLVLPKSPQPCRPRSKR